VCQPGHSRLYTNPSLMRKAGVIDYEAFGAAALELVGDRPISSRFFSDEFDEMERQSAPYRQVERECLRQGAGHQYQRRAVRRSLSSASRRAGSKSTVTAMFTVGQVKRIVECLAGGAPSFVSVFAGRIADSGIDPVPLMQSALALLAPASRR